MTEGGTGTIKVQKTTATSLLGKALVAGEVATRGYLALTAVSLCQGLFSLGINPQHTYVMAEEQSGARPPLWNSCFSSLWL